MVGMTPDYELMTTESYERESALRPVIIDTQRQFVLAFLFEGI